VSSFGGLCKVLKEINITLHPEYEILIAIKETYKGSFSSVNNIKNFISQK